MKKIVMMSVMLVAVVGWSQTVVKANQGAPGNQGPWEVTCDNCSGGGGGSGGGSFTPDGGFIGSVSPQPCRLLVQTNDAGVGLTALTVPAHPAAGRVWVQVCNSILNFSAALCICSTAKPTFSLGSTGDVLATGDCATYNVTVADGGVPWCVCNDAGTFLPATECVL